MYRMMLNRKSGKSGRNLISLFLDEYARHTRELAKGEEAHLALLNEILDVTAVSLSCLVLESPLVLTLVHPADTPSPAQGRQGRIQNSGASKLHRGSHL